MVMKTDAQMKNEIMEELLWDSTIKSRDITVRAHEGVVTLSGTVSNYAEKSAAELAVQRVSGVKAIAEELEVHVIEAALKRNAQLDAQCITVTTEEGRVTLTGEVRTWENRRDVAAAAWHAPGVTNVENLITVT